MDKKHILFVSARPSDFIEMKRAVKQVVKHNFDASLLYIDARETIDKDIFKEIKNLYKSKALKKFFISGDKNLIKAKAKAKAKAIAKVRVENRLATLMKVGNLFTRKSKALNYPLRIMFYIILRIILSGILSVAYMIRSLIWVRVVSEYFSHFNFYKKIFKKNEFNVVILPEDVVGLISPLVIKAAHKFKIPSLIIPYTICNQTEAFQSLKYNPKFNTSRPLNYLIKLFSRSWHMKTEEASLVRLPSFHVFSHWLLRVSPPDPWMMNSGYANAIAIESEQMRQYYRNAGLPDSKLKVVGAMYDDELALIVSNKLKEREKIYKQLGLLNDKPMLLLGGCPDQTKGTPPRFDFENIEECIDFICEQIKPFKQCYHVVMRPHPNHMEVGEYFKKHSITVTSLPTDELIAVSDVYIAHASATIRWAIACGVPVINYDVFYYNFSDFDAVRGVRKVNTRDEFSEAIKDLGSAKLAEMRQSLQAEKKTWAMLDGKSTERIISLINELCALDKVPRTAR